MLRVGGYVESHVSDFCQISNCSGRVRKLSVLIIKKQSPEVFSDPFLMFLSTHLLCKKIGHL